MGRLMCEKPMDTSKGLDRISCIRMLSLLVTWIIHALQRNPAALPAEVQAFVKGNAVPNQIVGALTNDGDPNLLLQVDIRSRHSGLPAPGTFAHHPSCYEQTSCSHSVHAGSVAVHCRGQPAMPQETQQGTGNNN